MINEVLMGSDNGGADLAIADLSVTSERAAAITFSMPWLNLGKCGYIFKNILHWD